MCVCVCVRSLGEHDSCAGWVPSHTPPEASFPPSVPSSHCQLGRRSGSETRRRRAVKTARRCCCEIWHVCNQAATLQFGDVYWKSVKENVFYLHHINYMWILIGTCAYRLSTSCRYRNNHVWLTQEPLFSISTHCCNVIYEEVRDKPLALLACKRFNGH